MADNVVVVSQPVNDVVAVQQTEVIFVEQVQYEVVQVQQRQIVEISAPGPQGPPGPAGPAGGSYFEFTQVTPVSTWIIPHMLNRKPHVTLNIGDEIIFADVVYTDLNTVTVYYAGPQSGSAYLS